MTADPPSLGSSHWTVISSGLGSGFAIESDGSDGWLGDVGVVIESVFESVDVPCVEIALAL